MLADAARREKRSKDGGGQVRLPDVDTRRLSGLKYKLINMLFQIGGRHGRRWHQVVPSNTKK